MVFDAALLNTQHYKVRIKDKVEQHWNNNNGVAPFLTPHCSSYWKGAFRSPMTKVANFNFTLYMYNLN